MVELADRPVLDSDVLIDYLRGRGPGADLVASLGMGGYWLTAVSAFELSLGRSYPRQREIVDSLLEAPCLPLGKQAGLRAGGLLRELRGSGQAIDIRDAMQAGICLDAGLPLVTGNLRHFERVPGLDAVDPDGWKQRATLP